MIAHCSSLKIFWCYLYYFLKNVEVFCYLKRTVLNVCIYDKKLFGQDSKDSNVNLSNLIPNPGYRVQNHWVAPRSTQPFMLPRLMKWVLGISGNWMVKSELPPRSGCSLEAIEPHQYKGAIKFGFFCPFQFTSHDRSENHQKLINLSSHWPFCQTGNLSCVQKPSLSCVRNQQNQRYQRLTGK